MIDRPAFLLPALAAALVTIAAIAPATAAAERPRHAAPADPAGPCGRYGPDYRAIGGTDTCLRFSGSVRAEMGLTTGGGGRDVGSFLSRSARKP